MTPVRGTVRKPGTSECVSRTVVGVVMASLRTQLVRAAEAIRFALRCSVGRGNGRVAAVPILETRVDVRAETFRRNREENLRLLGEVRALEEAVRRQAENARERFARRGQLIPRERVGRLLDPGAPYLELSTLAGLG